MRVNISTVPAEIINIIMDDAPVPLKGGQITIAATESN